MFANERDIFTHKISISVLTNLERRKYILPLLFYICLSFNKGMEEVMYCEYWDNNNKYWDRKNNTQLKKRDNIIELSLS